MPPPPEKPLKIERGIPAPESPGVPRKYPFHRMRVGESVAVPLEGRTSGLLQRILHRSAAHAGKKIRTRTEGEAVRAWVVSSSPAPAGEGR